MHPSTILLGLGGAWIAWQLTRTQNPYPYRVETLAPLRYNQETIDYAARARAYAEQATKGYPVTNKPTVPAPKPEPVKPVTLWRTPAKGMQYEPLFLSASEKHKLPPGLLSRVAWQESRYNAKAINKASNASGIMQIVPRWHPNVNPWDPAQAIPYAAKYLSDLKRQFGTWKKALAAYNWGPGNLQTYAIKPYGANWQNHLPDETTEYVRDIARDTGVT